MSKRLELAYRIDPALWVKKVLGIEPMDWQSQFLRARRGASIIVLTARQIGKTTTAAWAIAHCMLYNPGGLSVIACPAQRQSAEAVRRVKDILLQVGAKLSVDNVFGLELGNGSRVLALPGSDDSVRGLTVDGWIIADEAARLSEELIAAVRPMRARKPQARFAMLSTAWSRTDPFWTVWSNGDPSWLRLKATAELCGLYSEEQLAQEMRTLGEIAFKREYLGIPGGGGVSPFGWELYDRATRTLASLVPGAPIFNSRKYSPDDVNSWPLYKPIIAHDVGRSRDRSTAVVGGNNPYGQRELGIVAAHELPQNLFGSERANALAVIDREYDNSSLIVADLSNDATYGEILVQTFGNRVIGVHISRHGDGMGAERRFTHYGSLLVYTIGRTILLELLHREFQSDLIRLGDSNDIRRGYEQLANLDVDYREGGTVYQCAPGQHDDLAISFAILAWAAQHPHLNMWMRDVEARRRPRPPRPKVSWGAWT
ncbi:terminase large subunit domain-containing protein [Bradyrhizobium sp. STM 3562]|uniref:terminase large subunit domain-containing protein n=1 Tax=Bradyrhizobium sp. STM 3562 TaxID=578924 RepID=UPI00388DE483